MVAKIAKKQSKKSITDEILEKGKIPTIEERNIGGVIIRLMFDTRYYNKKDKSCNIAICVNYNGRWYYPTGKTATIDEYLRIVNAGTQGKWCEQKKELLVFFNYVETTVKELMPEFSIEKLKERIGKRSKVAKTDLFDFWNDFTETKSNYKTRISYKTALSSFKKFRKDVNLMVGDVTETLIKDWVEEMEEKENSKTTQGFYLRCLRAVLNCAFENNIITTKPKIAIPAGTRRTENFVSVADILKLKSFVAPDEWTDAEKRRVKRAIDWWLIIYCCNGCNSKDLANIKWNDKYFYDNELSFIRSKTKSKKEILVKIPIIPELAELLKKYGSNPEENKLVFPQILGNAKTEQQKDDRVHTFNKKVIRIWLKLACEKLKIRPITAQFARNSFITCLTHHGIAESYIDRAVGHSDNLLRGYQGEYSPKKRLKFNKMLFIDPELDD